MARARADRLPTRPFAVGAFTFVVDTAHDEDRRCVESLLRDLPPPGERRDAEGRFALLRDRSGRGWTVSGTRLGPESAPTSLDAALKLLLTAVNLGGLDAEPEHLHLHAAAATKDGRAVVMSAVRDTGKTTTVAHLVARGWGYVTDETVRVSDRAPEISGFPKPLAIKPGAHEHVDHLRRWMIPPDGADDGFRFVPVGATGGAVVAGGAPGLVVLLRRRLDGEEGTGPAVRWLHPADAVVALVQDTLDAQRFGAAAAQLAQVTSVGHNIELTMGTPTETADEIEALFARPRPEPLEVSVFPPSDLCAPTVTSVGVGDRVVVHDLATGRIFALDEGGTRVWRRLGGWSGGAEIDLDGPVIGPFVAQLRSFGVLTDAR